MKTIEQVAREVYTNATHDEQVAFKRGVEFAQQWISVDDELPTSEDGSVLVKLKDGRVTISFMLVCGDFAYNVKPTHWRKIEII